MSERMKSISMTDELSTWRGGWTGEVTALPPAGRTGAERGAHLVLLKELLEVVGARSQDAAVGSELDVLHHHGDVAVLALEPLLVQQLQEDALVLVVHVLDRLRHLRDGET